MSDIQNILEELGYRLVNEGQFWRTNGVYRGGSNRTAVRIRKADGRFTDFTENIGGTFYTLVKLTTGFKTAEECEKWLEEKKFSKDSIKAVKPKIYMQKTYPIECLDRLLPNYNYFNKRKISTETLEKFGGGVATYGKFLDRYVFPIYDTEDPSVILGFAGRDVTGTKTNKWKLTGGKINWCYPIFLNGENIKKAKEVVIVESIGDMLALFEVGYENVVCIFGTALQKGMFKFLIESHPKRILISLNKDKNGEGQKFAKKIKENLDKMFSDSFVEVAHPDGNDFLWMLEEHGKKSIELWLQKHKLSKI